MQRSAHGNMTPTFALTPASSKRSRFAAIREGITRISVAWGRRVRAVFRQIRSVTPDRWFTIFFLLLVLAFVVVLLVQPSAVGRGGR